MQLNFARFTFIHIIIILMKAGIYVHIPFCASRCVYCGFYSTTNTELRRQYVDALLNEMRMRRDEKMGRQQVMPDCIDSIYIGGGTPSTLALDDVHRILDTIYKLYPCKETREITIEMNPDDVTPDYVEFLRQFGVNRISLGVQTFDDQRLRFIHRRHTSAQAINAVATIRSANIPNVSIDLMFGFPNEAIDDWEKDLNVALSLNPDHISAYSLMYEEGTPLHKMLERGMVKQADDDLCLQMYTILMDTLKDNGYEHYEISNFCLPGKRAIHNSSYWNDTPYWGFGAAAHSYNSLTRSWNIANVKEYIKAISDNTLPSENELIDEDTHYDDLVTTSMRTTEGLNLAKLNTEYRTYALKNAKNDLRNGLLELNGDYLRLTRKGLFISDMVMSNLMKI